MSNSKRILAALLAGAMVLCAGCGKEEETEEESSNSTAVEVTDVTSGAMSSEYTLNGKIAAVNEVQVFPLLAGQVPFCLDGLRPTQRTIPGVLLSEVP